MSDTDLICRGDALDVLTDWSLDLAEAVAAMAALPAVQPAPVAVQTVLSNPLKDRGKMIKPFPGAPAGGYPLTPNPAEFAEAAPVTVEAAQAVRRFLKHRSVMSGIDRDAILTIGLSVSLTVADLEALVAYVIGPNQAGEAQ